MLTAAESVIEYRGGRAVPDRLDRRTHDHYVARARAMLEAFEKGIGKSRRALRRTIHGIFAEEDDCPLKRIRAFMKILDDASVFAAVPGTLRRRLETYGRHAAPDDTGMTAEQLFADHPDFRRLESFAGFASPRRLLSRYNVAQLQAAMYRAEEMVIHLESDYKKAVRNINLARLLHDITPLSSGGYRIVLSGPLSPLHPTSRYGTALARFVPALLACGRWRMRASIIGPWQTRATLAVSAADGYQSHLDPDEPFDSKVEADFAAQFGRRRGGWELIREGRLLYRAQKVCIPDFLLRNDRGDEVLLEIAGFWTPEYLQEKLSTLAVFGDRNLLLAVPEKSPAARVLPAKNTIVYRDRLRAASVLEKLETI